MFPSLEWKPYQGCKQLFWPKKPKRHVLRLLKSCFLRNACSWWKCEWIYKFPLRQGGFCKLRKWNTSNFGSPDALVENVVPQSSRPALLLYFHPKQNCGSREAGLAYASLAPLPLAPPKSCLSSRSLILCRKWRHCKHANLRKCYTTTENLN